MAKPPIEPKILKGFRDILPEDAQLRANLFAKLQHIFSLANYQPIDTPALEYAEIILGKGSEETDKQLYRFKDQGERDIALRFDLTVPLARYISQNQNDLVFPFRRYHIAPVWRADKPQKGRYREFYQCDFDIIGSTHVSSDIETLSIVKAFFNFLGLGYKVRINHRGILNAIIEKYFTANSDLETKISIMRAIDKLEKQGSELVAKELIKNTKLEESKVLQFLSSLTEMSNEKDQNSNIKKLRESLQTNAQIGPTIDDCEKILDALNDQEQALGSFVFDMSIARGLDYYTGIVFETQLTDYPEIGSVCSGGRYDNLTSLFSVRKFPGVGGSVGIDRLLSIAEEANLNLKNKDSKRILITVFSGEFLDNYLSLASELRANNIICEVFLGEGKLGEQLKYASKKNIPYAIIMGENEIKSGTVILKDLCSKEADNQKTILKKDIINSLKGI